MKKRRAKTVGKVIGGLIGLYVIYFVFTAIILVALRTPPDVVERDVTFMETDERVTLLGYGLEAFGARMDIIDQAEETIDVSYFYMEDGESVQLFYAYILAAADRGVEVRYILDGIFHGVRGDDRDVLRAFNAHPNIELKLYEPIVSVVLAPWRLNNRLHDKLLLVDNQYAIVGGRNVGDLYYERSDQDVNYSHDRDVLLINEDQAEDSLINDMRSYYTELFESDYAKTEDNRNLFNWEQDLADEKIATLTEAYEEHQSELEERENVSNVENWIDRSVEINSGFFTHNSIERNFKQPYIWSDMLTLASQAEESLFIQSPWTIPDRHMRRHIEEANITVEQGILLTNGMSTNSNMVAQSGTENRRQYFVDSFLDYYEYRPKEASLHMKTMVVDEQISAVGAFNFDARSTYLSTESMIVLDSEELAEQILAEAEESYLKKSVLYEPDGTFVPGEKTDEKEAIWWQRLLIPAMRPIAWALESLL
ncbi:MAG: phospholipase D family protein [Alkalibacterium sp.]|nr:phospholipase D family protein [Alkalibacterium sp.]